MPLDRTNKMTLRVALEELPMNDVNVFACVNDHNATLVEVLAKSLNYRLRIFTENITPRFAFSVYRQTEGSAISHGLATALIDKEGKIDTNLGRQCPNTLQFVEEIKRRRS